MIAYLIRRVTLMIPTLFGIMLINFIVVQFAPGGPIEQTIARLKGSAVSATENITRGSGDIAQSAGTDARSGSENNSQYRGARGLDPRFIKELERLYGFDKPAPERFWMMMKNYVRFDFGQSWFKGGSVIGLIISKLPVSISLGLWTTILIYLISIPLGVAKALRDGSSFDIWTSTALIIGVAIPSFLFAILLVVVFAGGSYLNWFPLRGLVSDNWSQFSTWHKITDYFWHMILPVTAMVIGSFAGLTMLTKNSFIDQINQQYVTTARAKGASENRVLYGHVFRNAMLIVIAGFPATFISILFTSSLLIEIIFSLDGLGLLGYEAVLDRDYPIVFGTLYIFSLIGMLTQLISDVTYTLVDPRIDFEAREL